MVKHTLDDIDIFRASLLTEDDKSADFTAQVMSRLHPAPVRRRISIFTMLEWCLPAAGYVTAMIALLLLATGYPPPEEAAEVTTDNVLFTSMVPAETMMTELFWGMHTPGEEE